jgi:two-component system, HptB-dependent secretion and biofilm response regulator
MINSDNATALIVDDEMTNRLILKSLLKKLGYITMEAVNGIEAVQMFGEHSPSIIFMDVMMPEMDGYEATRLIKESAGNKFIPIIFLTAMTDQESLARCIEAGGDDFLVKPYDKFLLQSKIKSMERIAKLNREVQGMYSMIRREQEIAESVFINAIQGTNISHPNLRQTIRPAGTFSGDMVLSAYNPTRDLLFLVGDFTGHGLAAALGALPVSEIFRAMTTKGFSPENILSAINKKLKSLLPVGIFFGVQLVLLNHDLKYVRIFNAGMPPTLIVDPETGDIKHSIKSAGLPLGIIDTLDTKEMGQYVPISPGDRVLMYSDGLLEARNDEDEEYGDDRFLDTIVQAQDGKIFDNILSALDKFCGDTVQPDDVTLVEISCTYDVLPQIEASTSDAVKVSGLVGSSGDWSMSLRFNGSRLRETNPVPILVSHLMELENLQAQKQSLFTVMTELYVNALDHGVLGLDSNLKSDASGFAQYFQERENRLAKLDDGYVYFDLAVDFTDNTHSILLRVEDSGNGFDFTNIVDPADLPDTALSGRGISLVKTLCQTLEFEGRGNVVRAIIQW